ncbi:MAG: HAMP domain-containing protein [Phycisphaerales bacterium]|nr:HAMP domain-containing protein [Phycisphaerales bacterium]
MSLQVKFVILFTFITLIVAMSLGAALHFGHQLERELTQPYQRTVNSLALLGDLSQTARSRTPDRARRLRELMQHLENDPAAQQIGPGTLRNLHDRTQALLDAPVDDARVGELLALIDRTEATLHRAAAHEQSFGRHLSRSYRAILIVGLLLSVLTSILGALLVRRWLVKPVLNLHEAAEEFAAGHLAHRAAITGPGELATLGAKLNDMASTIDHMQRDAVERERLAAMGEMVRRLAHNIRSPIAGIRGMAELSLRRADRGEPIENQQQEIIEAVDRFDLCLTELVDVTTPCRVHLAPADPRAWLRHVMQSVQPIADTKGQHLVLDTAEAPETVLIDERHLEHATVAILTNAIEVGPRGSDLNVRIRRDDAQCWSLSITDQGPGIPPDVLERIFQPYFTTKRNGNGIGLAVAFEVARQHRGTIDVETQPGRGTTMSVRLPLNPTETPTC